MGSLGNFIAPYRGFVPRFGSYAGPDYAARRTLGPSDQLTMQDWLVKPINFLDSVTRDHDINYTYIDRVFAGRPAAEIARAQWEADKEMFVNVMAVTPAPGDFITVAYRNALIDGFIFKARSQIGYGLDAEVREFWSTVISKIAPNVPLPDPGVRNLLYSGNKYVALGMQDLTTCGLSMQMQLLFNQHITDPANLQPRSTAIRGSDGGPPDPIDYKNTLIIPDRTLLSSSTTEANRYIYTWSGNVGGNAVTISYNEQTRQYLRETYSSTGLIERVSGIPVNPSLAPGMYGQFDQNITTSKFDKNGQLQSAVSTVLRGEADRPTTLTDHFKTFYKIITEGNIESIPKGQGDPAWISRPIKPATPSSLEAGLKVLAEGLPTEFTLDEVSQLQIADVRVGVLTSQIPADILGDAIELARIANLQGLRTSLTDELALRPDVIALQTRIEQSGFKSKIDELIQVITTSQEIIFAAAERVAIKLDRPISTFINGAADLDKLAAVGVSALVGGGTSTRSDSAVDETSTVVERNQQGAFIGTTVTQQLAGGQTVTRSYDANSKLRSTTTTTGNVATGYTTSITYADGSNVTTVLNPDGSQASANAAVAPLTGLGTAVTDIDAIVQAAANGKLNAAVISAGTNFLNNQINPILGGAPVITSPVLYEVNSFASGIAGGFALQQAFSSSGSDTARFTSTLNAVVALNKATNAVYTALSESPAVAQIANESLNRVAESIAENSPLSTLRWPLKTVTTQAPL
jgi:YD repeat-containing protein